MCNRCDLEDHFQDEETEEQEIARENLVSTVQTLLRLATPRTRKRIQKHLEIGRLCSGTIYRSGAVCLLGTAVPVNRRKHYEGHSTIEADDWDRWFNQYSYQSDISADWDTAFDTLGSDRTREIALQAIQQWEAAHV